MSEEKWKLIAGSSPRSWQLAAALAETASSLELKPDLALLLLGWAGRASNPSLMSCLEIWALWM